MADINTQHKTIIHVQAAANSSVSGYVVMCKYDPFGFIPGEKVYLGKKERYDQKGNYDNSDGSAIYVSDNGHMFSFLDASPGWVLSQSQMLQEGLTKADYLEYARILKTLTKQFPDMQVKKFSVRPSKKGSGLPFQADLCDTAQ